MMGQIHSCSNFLVCGDPEVAQSAALFTWNWMQRLLERLLNGSCAGRGTDPHFIHGEIKKIAHEQPIRAHHGTRSLCFPHKWHQFCCSSSVLSVFYRMRGWLALRVLISLDAHAPPGSAQRLRCALRSAGSSRRAEHKQATDSEQGDAKENGCGWEATEWPRTGFAQTSPLFLSFPDPLLLSGALCVMEHKSASCPETASEFILSPAAAESFHW